MHSTLSERLGMDHTIFAFSHCRDVVAGVSTGWLSPEQLAEELNWLDERVEGGYGVDVVIPQKYEGMDVEIASIPEQIRGYGYVKEEHLQKAKSYEAEMLAAWRNETPSEEAA
jgi:hypothetical protein